MIKYRDKKTNQEVWEVNKEDFHCGQICVYDSEEIVNIPGYIDVYKSATNEFHHVQYFPEELIESYELFNWSDVERRHSQGDQKECLVYNFEDWLEGRAPWVLEGKSLRELKEKWGDIRNYNSMRHISVEDFKRIIESVDGNYFAKGMMKLEDRSRIGEKQKELFSEYVEETFEKFKGFFENSFNEIEHGEDKQAFLKRIIYSVKSNILDDMDYKEEEHITNPPPIKFRVKRGDKFLTRELNLRNNTCADIRNIYQEIFLNGEKTTDFSFVKCRNRDPFYSSLEDELLLYEPEILCYSLHKYRGWLKEFSFIPNKNSGPDKNKKRDSSDTQSSSDPVFGPGVYGKFIYLYYKSRDKGWTSNATDILNIKRNYSIPYNEEKLRQAVRRVVNKRGQKNEISGKNRNRRLDEIKAFFKKNEERPDLEILIKNKHDTSLVNYYYNEIIA